MRTLKEDRAMTEVREWRAKLQKELEGLSPEEASEFINRRAEEAIRTYNLNLKNVGKDD